MSEPKEFVLTADHLKLLRAANVTWYEIETGAPAIDGKRPYGNSNVIDDIADILGIDGFLDHESTRHLSAQEYDYCRARHAETETALQIVLASGEFTPGTYRTSDAYSRDWVRVA